ncbi:MAG: isoaspartyl peptidase/L-asparaginase [Acidobacteriota bacterium]|nr:isoaspartyl peptidase/L-asparaginase [Acidobacteriota bacterium]
MREHRTQSEERHESRRKFLVHAAAGLSAAAALGPCSEVAAGAPPVADQQTPRDRPTGRREVPPEIAPPPFAFAIHGGVGTLNKSEMTPPIEREYRAALDAALTAGHTILRGGGSGLDAVVAAIKVMEDAPLFNAGKGAVFTSAGTHELDASIMNGNNLKAGAVSTLKHIRNPIVLARLVMDESKHVMMVGDGAEAFARQQGLQFVPQKYFYTERRWRALQQIKEEERKQRKLSKSTGRLSERVADKRELFGTVGAVALDGAGNLAAGTSTGGMTNKKFGRVGDSPIIGAGTYADNRTCAVSATGDGEYFIRLGVARDISAMIEYQNTPVEDAARRVIEKVGKLGGEGGVIAVDRTGRITMIFNTEGMYRGQVGADGKKLIEIFKS